MSGLSDETRIYVKSGGFKTCFIQQDVCQHLLQGLTVRQALVYASRLKNSRISAHLDHQMIASELMSSLVISDTADNRVETCSGGEHKRIVIACELTAHIKPNMLCIDEPTSGLDSSAALVVINCLKVLSRRHGMTIIASIHQPNNDLFHMFDNIYVLANGGVCLYSGPPLPLRHHLHDCDIELTQNDVPIEVVLTIASDGKRMTDFEKLMSKQNSYQSDDKLIEENMRLVYGKQSPTKRFSFRDVNCLLMRSMRYAYISQWKTFALKIAMLIYTGIMLRIIFGTEIIVPDGCMTIEFGSGCDQGESNIINDNLIKDNIKFMMVLVVVVPMLIMFVFSISFCTEVEIFCSEHHNAFI
ncbi:unnamed protein product [Oppiella nova]|uniref:ABC transporter domain-containing protein n=1 Tax=Oppiella nova TaxID=334625 RepID=A0A7R9M8W6_9ACAR|nr:unnamed protein product [Oppiella nova]CAG2172983.1 unnamed protein product [Oppiella nova]